MEALNFAVLLFKDIFQIEFFPYTDHGDFFWKDGEYFARKVTFEEKTIKETISCFSDIKMMKNFRVLEECAWSPIPMLPLMSL